MIKSIAKFIYRTVPVKGPLFKTVRTIFQPTERVYRHLHFKGPFSTQLPGGSAFRMMHFGAPTMKKLGASTNPLLVEVGPTKPISSVIKGG